jgi:hypothetical protein
MSHYTEAFIEGTEALTERTGAPWGWQCFTCGAERVGFPTLKAAELAADEHNASGEQGV